MYASNSRPSQSSPSPSSVSRDGGPDRHRARRRDSACVDSRWTQRVTSRGNARLCPYENVSLLARASAGAGRVRFARFTTATPRRASVRSRPRAAFPVARSCTLLPLRRSCRSKIDRSARRRERHDPYGREEKDDDAARCRSIRRRSASWKVGASFFPPDYYVSRQASRQDPFPRRRAGPMFQSGQKIDRKPPIGASLSMAPAPPPASPGFLQAVPVLVRNARERHGARDLVTAASAG